MAAETSPRRAPLRLAVRVLPVIVGFSSITGQFVLLRELMVLSNGNELSLGVMLACWLAWNALGSLAGGRLFRKHNDVGPQAAWVWAGCGLSLPATLWAMRWARVLVSSAPTELISPGSTLVICVACLGVFCALSGFLFSLVVRIFARSAQSSIPRALGYAYLLETAGTAMGGIIAAIVFFRFLAPFQIAFLVSAVDMCAAALLIPVRMAWRGAAILMIASATPPLVLRVAPGVEHRSRQNQWGPLQVIASVDSIYGRITVTDAGGMLSIYEDGSILANVPDKAAAEESVHYALLEHPAPRRVLLLGGSANGSIAEALQHPDLEQLDIVELDPALISVLPALRSEEPPKVHSHFGDGRHYLRTAHAKFDVIVLNVPNPETAQWNRFYTTEFFRIARRRLQPGGILALHLPSSEEFISPQRAELLRCIRATLGQVFPYVTAIPGNPIHMFGTEEANLLTEDPRALVARLHARNLDTQYVSEYMIPFRMARDRIESVTQVLQPGPRTPINSDFHPVAYYLNETLWSSQFHSTYGDLLRGVARIPAWLLYACASCPFLACALLFLRPGGLNRGREFAAGWSVCASGYCLMTLQILLLLTFQCVYGYLYYEMSLLIGMFMAGIAVGSWMALRLNSGPRMVRWASVNQLAMAASAPALMALAALLARAPEELAGKPLAAMGFPAVALLCGIPGGLQFPLIAEIACWTAAPHRSRWIYALDLLGGCAGALVTTGFLVPVYGLWNTAWLAAAVTAGPALWLSRVQATGKPTSMMSSDALQILPR